MIQALVKSPDSGAPAEETEGVGEVLEVRSGCWELEEGGGPRAPLNPSCHPPSQFDYEYTESGERLVLGKGTYGVVYAGRDRHTRVRIAIKEIPERDSRFGGGGAQGAREQVGGSHGRDRKLRGSCGPDCRPGRRKGPHGRD